MSVIDKRQGQLNYLVVRVRFARLVSFSAQLQQDSTTHGKDRDRIEGMVMADIELITRGVSSETRNAGAACGEAIESSESCVHKGGFDSTGTRSLAERSVRRDGSPTELPAQIAEARPRVDRIGSLLQWM